MSDANGDLIGRQHAAIARLQGEAAALRQALAALRERCATAEQEAAEALVREGAASLRASEMHGKLMETQTELWALHTAVFDHNIASLGAGRTIKELRAADERLAQQTRELIERRVAARAESTVDESLSLHLDDGISALAQRTEHAESRWRAWEDYAVAQERRAEAAEQALGDALGSDAGQALLSERDELRDRAEQRTAQYLEQQVLTQREYEARLATEREAALYRGTIDSARILLQARPIKTPFDNDVIRMLEHTLAERDAGQVLLARLAAAEAVVGTVKEVLAREASRSALTVALVNYDEAVKGANRSATQDLDAILRSLADLTPVAQQRYEAEAYEDVPRDVEQLRLSLEEWYDGGTWRCGWRVQPDEATEWTALYADGDTPSEAAGKLLAKMEAEK